MIFNSKPNENSYYCQFLLQLDEQRKKDTCDISIMINGKNFEGHRNILARGNPLFRFYNAFQTKT